MHAGRKFSVRLNHPEAEARATHARRKRFSATERVRLLAGCYNNSVVTVEIITIGNEILLGLIQDTNSNYLCRVVRGMGGRVRRIAIVRDEVDHISAELGASLARQPDLIITCGGLGPTDDDLTLAAVALGTGRQLLLDADAREFVERKYRALAD